MEQLQIVLVENEEGDRLLDNYYTDVPMSKIHDLRIEKAAILKEGMGSGRPSISLCIPLPNDELAIVQLTPNILEGLVKAVHGVEGRIGPQGISNN